MLEKLAKIATVGDEPGLVQVPAATVTKGMIIPVASCILVSQNEPITEIAFERMDLLLEHDL